MIQLRSHKRCRQSLISVFTVCLQNVLLTLNAPIATEVVCFSRLLNCLKSLYDKPCGPRSVCSGSMLFSSIFNLSVILGNYLHFFLGALRVKIWIKMKYAAKKPLKWKEWEIPFKLKWPKYSVCANRTMAFFLIKLNIANDGTKNAKLQTLTCCILTIISTNWSLGSLNSVLW